MKTKPKNHATRIVNGTHYHRETPQEVIEVLEMSRQMNTRIRVHYGDVKTGRDWGDLYDVTGTIGRSMGLTKVPLMISNITSNGGPAMLDHCIVRIRHANRRHGGDLYRHPNYTPPAFDVVNSESGWRNNFS